MNSSRPISLFLLLLLATPMQAQGQEKEKTPEEAAEDQRLSELTSEEREQIMQQMMALARPGAEHKLLSKLVGKWSLETKMWPTPDTTEPQVVEGIGHNRLILGGMFLEVRSETRFGGMSSESLSILGFDRRKEVFTAISFDSMGSYSVSAAGPYDADKGQTVMSGTDWEPTANYTQRYDFVLTWVDEETYRFEIIFKDRGHGNTEPYKMVEITAHRQAD